MSDVRDILEIERSQTPELSIENIINDPKKLKRKKGDVGVSKRPEGMHRELYALLYSDGNRDAPPILPSDTGPQSGYKQMKAKLGLRRVRPWKWMPFTNPARKDGTILHHWRRIADEGKEYPFAKFNKIVPVPSYSDSDYSSHLHSESWTRAETDHLFDLCRRFDLRFVIVHDRWDRCQYSDRSVEDLKERYYDINNTLNKLRNSQPSSNVKMKVYDAEHEKKRKEQLRRLFDRTQEQIEEEQNLLNELKKIELRKKERDKKAQDLQKLITAADNSSESRRQDRKSAKKKLSLQKAAKAEGSVEMTGIKFADSKSSGASLRSQKMKLPVAVGQKKSKAIEQLLQELGVELNPIPTEEVCVHFNELRSDMVLLYELKLALANCEFEIQTLRHRYEALAPGKTIEIPMPANVTTPVTKSAEETPPVTGDVTTVIKTEDEDDTTAANKQKTISEMIDVGSSSPNSTPNKKKRLAAIEQENVLKKIKKP